MNDIAEYIQRGKSPKYSEIEQIPVIAQKCNQWSGFNIKKAKFIIPETISTYSEERLLQDKDLLWNSTGLGTLGRMAIYEKNKNPYGIAVADSHVTVLRMFKTFVIPEYVFLWISSPAVQLYIEAKSEGTTKQKELYVNTVKNHMIPLPPLNEQRKILDKYNTFNLFLTEYNEYEIKNTELETNFPKLLKKSLLQYAIQGKLVPQDPNDEPASVLLERIRAEKEQLIKEGKIKRDKNDSYIYRGSDNSYYLKTNSDNVCIGDEIPFEIPPNWCWCSLSELITYQNGYAFSKTDFSDDASAGIPVIKSNNIMSLTVKINSKTDYVVNPNEKMMSSAIHKGDLLMCLSSQSSNTEPLGKTALYKWDEIALLNQRVLKLTPINIQITEYLYWLINSEYFHYTVSHRSGGSAQSNLKLEHVLTMVIPLPPLHEQQRIVNAINNINILLDC